MTYDGLFVMGTGGHCECGTGWIAAGSYESEAEAKAACISLGVDTCMYHGGCCGHYWVMQAMGYYNLYICCNG